MITSQELARYDSHEDKRNKQEVDALRAIAANLASINAMLASINAHLFSLSSGMKHQYDFDEETGDINECRSK